MADQQLLDQLNDEQKQAVLHQRGPAIVLAGAGSGKTRVLTSRAAHLLNSSSLAADNILLLTFTNKAANEMKKRVYQYSGRQLFFSGTFHSLGAKLLRMVSQQSRQQGHDLIIQQRHISPQFTIYDNQDQINLLKQLYKQYGFTQQQFKLGLVKAVISHYKNQLLDPDEAKQLATDQTSRDIAKLYQLYQQRLQAEQALDFDDLLVLTYYMLLEYPQVAAHYQQQFQQVLIDEYQDTNYVQYLLGKLLAAPQQNLFVVGDFSQSIYAWRGADYRNLQRLSQDFSDLTEYRLERNYRSPQHILDAATQVIKQNQSHPILELWTDKPDQIQQKIEVYELESGELEAVKVSQIISEQLRNNLTEVAILYRTNAQSRLFEEALINRQIPYHIVGGTKFYERQEIKDLLAYLRLAVNELDSPSLNRALKLGKRRFKKFQSWLQQVEQTVLDNPLTALQGILEATAYQDRFDAKNPEDQSRLDNIQELLNVAGQFPQSLQFLENVALIQDDYLLDQTQVQPNPGVTLMSLHSAKGLEFATVFMVGLEEGLLPHARSLLEIASLEEERRLCYVGITRAKERLILTCARHRYNYGNHYQAVASRFLSEIEPKLLTIHRQFEAEDSSLPFPRRSRSSRIKRSQTHSKRRLVIDDEQLDALLHDELDVQDFLNQ